MCVDFFNISHESSVQKYYCHGYSLRWAGDIKCTTTCAEFRGPGSLAWSLGGDMTRSKKGRTVVWRRHLKSCKKLCVKWVWAAAVVQFQRDGDGGVAHVKDFLNLLWSFSFLWRAVCTLHLYFYIDAVTAPAWPLGWLCLSFPLCNSLSTRQVKNSL